MGVDGVHVELPRKRKTDIERHGGHHELTTQELRTDLTRALHRYGIEGRKEDSCGIVMVPQLRKGLVDDRALGVESGVTRIVLDLHVDEDVAWNDFHRFSQSRHVRCHLTQDDEVEGGEDPYGRIALIVVHDEHTILGAAHIEFDAVGTGLNGE